METIQSLQWSLFMLCLDFTCVFMNLHSWWYFICSVSPNLFWRWRFLFYLISTLPTIAIARNHPMYIHIYLRLNYSTDSSRRVLCCQMRKCEIVWNNVVLNCLESAIRGTGLLVQEKTWLMKYSNTSGRRSVNWYHNILVRRW